MNNEAYSVLYKNLKSESKILRSVEMSDKMWDIISDKIYLTYKNACIMWIFKVCNENLENDQAALKIHLENYGKVETLELFHGTKSYLIETIASQGFDVTKNKVAIHGNGTYAAKNANYSTKFMNIDQNEISYMFLTNMLVGRKFQGAGKLNTELYDNFVDNLKSPSIFVTPYDSGCIPKYVIAFHINAK
jgi:hypothetical protein